MRVLLHLWIAALALAPAIAHADKKTEAKEHFEKAGAAHKEGRYDDALTELNIAYTLDPNPAFLYSIGQVKVMQGECGEAIVFYQRFIESKPSAEATAKAQEAIDTCKRLEPEKKEKAPPEKVYVTKTQTIHTRTKPWYTDAVGDTFLILGVVAGGASGFFYYQAIQDRDTADTAENYEAYDELVARAKMRQTYSWALAGGAGLFVTCAFISYAVRDRTEESRSVALVPTSDGAMVTWAGRF